MKGPRTKPSQTPLLVGQGYPQNMPKKMCQQGVMCFFSSLMWDVVFQGLDLTCSSRSGLIARIFCCFWAFLFDSRSPLDTNWGSRYMGKDQLMLPHFSSRGLNKSSHIWGSSLLHACRLLKVNLRSNPDSDSTGDSETTVQKLRFSNYDSETTVQKLRFRPTIQKLPMVQKPRFRHFPPPLATHAFNDSWQPMLSMIQVQVQHFFHQKFSPPLLATRSKLYWLKLADEMMPLKKSTKNARAMETSDHVTFGLCPHL